jgi:hypothetical protein
MNTFGDPAVLRQGFPIQVGQFVTNINRFNIFIVMLVVLLTVTSLSVAQARFMPDAVGNIVLCTGDGQVKVLVDAEGQPATGSHICPDSVVSLVGLNYGSQSELTNLPTKLSDFVRAPSKVGQIKSLYDWPLARAPPYFVQA